jgi:hypothetical protein
MLASAQNPPTQVGKQGPNHIYLKVSKKEIEPPEHYQMSS